MLEEYVTGAVLDALESPRVQQAVTAGADTDAPRRAELLAEIRKAQDKRAEARRDWAEDVIDKEDWLDIKQRTDDRINRARTEYDRLTGTTTVFGDIPHPMRYAMRGSSGTPTGAAPPSRPSSTGSRSARTARGARDPGTARCGWKPCASRRNSTGGSGEQQSGC